MTEVVYKHLRSRNRISVARRGCYATPALVVVDSLPTKYRNMIYERYNDLRAQSAAVSFIDRIVPDAQAKLFFEDYILDDGRHLPEDKQIEYCNNAAILNTCLSLLETSASHRKRQGGARLSMSKFWGDRAADMPRIADVYPHSLPEHPRRLQERYKVYRKDGYESLISRKYLNGNAAKVDDEVKESLITELISDHRNLDNEQVVRLYNLVAERMGWKVITRQSVAVWRDKIDLVSFAGRRGKAAFRNNKTMQVKRKPPTYPLLYWTIDGWDAELLYQQTSTDKKGHSVTTYHNRLTVVVILDAFCKYPIGYAIGDHESPDLIRQALRNATNHTAELFGIRYRANQLQSDHYAIKNLTPTYNVLAKAVTPARVTNSKAKIIEPYFGEINKNYCQLMPNWSGFGVTSDKENQPNQDVLNAIRKSFPDRDGCMRQIAHIINMERQAKRDKYVQRFEALPESNRLPLSDQKYLLEFGESTPPNALTGSGITPTINGIRQYYDCFDPNFRRYAHVRWTVKYDSQDLSRALAVNDDASLQFLLQAKHIQPMALAEREDGDAEALKAVSDFNKSLEQSVVERRAITSNTTRELFAANPCLNDTLSKLVLVDSKGQHKDERNASRSLQSHADIDIDAAITAAIDSDDSNLYDLY